MRFEINISDTMRLDLVARIVSLVERLSVQPEFVEQIVWSDGEDIEAIFTPDVVAKLDAGCPTA